MRAKVRMPAIALVTLLLAGSSLQTFAWNDRGHMSVAYFAYKQLKPATRDRVNSLLRLNPKYADWAATADTEAPGASADEKNLMIFMIAATWADQIKRDSSYIKDGNQGGRSEEHTSELQSLAYL